MGFIFCLNAKHQCTTAITITTSIIKLNGQSLLIFTQHLSLLTSGFFGQRSRRGISTNMVLFICFKHTHHCSANVNIFYFPGILKNIIYSLCFTKKRRKLKNTTIFFTHARQAIFPDYFLKTVKWASCGSLARFFLLGESSGNFINVTQRMKIFFIYWNALRSQEWVAIHR